jgi:hypothetical protein
MGKPVSSVGGASAPAPIQSPTQSPIQSPSQSPVQSPVATEPRKFWPPAFGWRLSALGGERSSHNAWQATWLKTGSAIAGGGAIDSVAELKTKLVPHLSHGARGRWS